MLLLSLIQANNSFTKDEINELHVTHKATGDIKNLVYLEFLQLLV